MKVYFKNITTVFEITNIKIMYSRMFNNVYCTLCFCLFSGIIYSNQEKNYANRPVSPNIIYILADDLGYGEVGFNGQEKILTPELDKMAKMGLVFKHHYSGGAVCGPSRSVLITGKSQAIGFIKNNPGNMWQRENLLDNEITIAEKLKEAGYSTACIGKWGLGPQGKSGYPLNQGFDEFIGYDTHVSAHNYYPKGLCKNGGRMRLKGNSDVKKGELGKTYSHDVFTKSALEFLKRKHKKPFFLYLAFTIPHAPYNPPSLEPYSHMPWTENQKKYAAMITRMDRDIGKVLTALQEQGIAENTLVVFTSDNGTSVPGVEREALPGIDFFKSSGPFRGIKRDMFEGGFRVPTIFWWPGKIQEGETDHISGFQDVMPTLCELTGVESPKNIDGISLLPTLFGNPEKQGEHDYLYWEFCLMTKNGGSKGIQAVLDVKNRLKAIRKTKSGTVQLYDIGNDTSEVKDIANRFPEKAAMLNAKMNSMRGESELWPLRYFD